VKQQSTSPRRVAREVLDAVLVRGRSLSSAGGRIRESLSEPRDRGFAMELVYGVLRWRFRLEALLAQLMKKPVRSKDYELQLVLMIALYELTELNAPDYAVVDEAVRQTKQSGRKWAAGMVNAVLRAFKRDPGKYLSAIEADTAACYSHPPWLLAQLRQDWPDDWRRILEANNERPPMWLRVNARCCTADDYLRQLADCGIGAVRHEHAPQALRLERAVDVGELPGFAEGRVSVQDAAAQLAASLLDAGAGQRVLDLCAAPGGKTCHILELQPALAEMVAVELEAQRMQRVEENLQRLGMQASLLVADAGDADAWWDGRGFDRILVDAPCSASGVIRRHPDIKSLRHADDLAQLLEVQRRILRQAWRLLQPGGVLLYVTCSVFRQENEQQIEALLSDCADAEELSIDADWGHACRYGRQLLPGETGADGFYFACLQKRMA
jgi:16S rRNA (cytosine967-C5)-methyltransferase